jgi:hypothetical protein
MVFNGVKSHTKPIRGFNRWRVGPESQTWAIVRYKQKNERRCTDSELDCKWEGGKVQFVRGGFDFNFYLQSPIVFLLFVLALYFELAFEYSWY